VEAAAHLAEQVDVSAGAVRRRLVQAMAVAAVCWELLRALQRVRVAADCVRCDAAISTAAAMAAELTTALHASLAQDDATGTAGHSAVLGQESLAANLQSMNRHEGFLGIHAHYFSPILGPAEGLSQFETPTAMSLSPAAIVRRRVRARLRERQRMDDLASPHPRQQAVMLVQAALVCRCDVGSRSGGSGSRVTATVPDCVHGPDEGDNSPESLFRSPAFSHALNCADRIVGAASLHDVLHTCDRLPPGFLSRGAVCGFELGACELLLRLMREPISPTVAPQ